MYCVLREAIQMDDTKQTRPFLRILAMEVFKKWLI